MDIRQLSEQQIMEMLKKGEKIPYYPNLSNPRMEAVTDSFEDILHQESKLSRALSRGISEQKGFHGKTKTTDIVRELSKDLDIEPPSVEYSYQRPNAAGWAHSDQNKIGINPQLLDEYGREGLIAHELRHKKELVPSGTMDNSIRNILYSPDSSTGNDLQDLINSFHKASEFDGAVKKEKGKALNYYQKVNERLFPNDKLKYSVDALDMHDFLSKGHFKSSFLKKNLERVAKGLPIIGTAATVAGALGYSDIAGAATDMATGPIGGVEEMGVSPEQKDLDIAYLNKIRQMNQRKK